jgi:DNA-binding transcriptional regulator GbsR (MarR family)
MMKLISQFCLRIPAPIFILFVGMILVRADLEAQEPDQVKRELFREVDAAFEQARREEVPTLAPKLFPKALKLYHRAEKDYKKEERISKIRERIQQALQAIKKATEAARVSRVALAQLLTTRQEASKREYIDLAPKKFAQAERDYQAAILKA